MEFIDRVSAYPGRYIMTTEDGSTSYVILERADEPTTPGTPLNAETFNAMFDDITGYGSNENGKYWKFADGTLMCCKTANVQLNMTKAWGSLYEGSVDLGDWPYPFADSPDAHVNNMSYVGVLFECWESAPTETHCGVAVFCRGTSYNESSEIEIRVFGLGRWK